MGKYEHEILNEMRPDEYARWEAYLNIKSSDIKKSRKKAGKKY